MHTGCVHTGFYAAARVLSPRRLAAL
jgi:hypothetical protein